MNLKKGFDLTNEGVWVVLGWAVIGMFVFTTALVVIGVVGWIVGWILF